ADEVDIDLSEGAARRPPLKFRVLAERETPRVTRLLKRGEFLQPGDEVLPALPAIANRESTDDPKAVNRLDLARWLVNPGNPLALRVTANHIWLRLFGQGLVRTPEDFGARGERPKHPELLDWLASELKRRDWSQKAMIRKI